MPRQTLKVAACVVLAWTLLLFVYGLATYPDAPYKACNSASGYCGKTRLSHTESEFHAEQKWETAILVSAPFGILAAIYLVRSRKRHA